MRGAQRVSDRRLRACLSDLVVHVIPVDRSSRRATVCVNYHARAQWSNSGLQVEDLKAAITPSHQPARSACSRNGKMSPPFRTLRSTTSSNLKKLFVVPRAIASCVGLRSVFTTWTDCPEPWSVVSDVFRTIVGRSGRHWTTSSDVFSGRIGRMTGRHIGRIGRIPDVSDENRTTQRAPSSFVSESIFRT